MNKNKIKRSELSNLININTQIENLKQKVNHYEHFLLGIVEDCEWATKSQLHIMAKVENKPSTELIPINLFDVEKLVKKVIKSLSKQIQQLESNFEKDENNDQKK